MEYIIRKCMKCGAVVRSIHDCNCKDCGIMCCGDVMKKLVPNSEDASFEKHVPIYEVKGNKIYIHVDHAMDKEHYIEWVSVVYSDKEVVKYFNPGSDNYFSCDYNSGCVIYSYCNKHGLWKKDVE